MGITIHKGVISTAILSGITFLSLWFLFFDKMDRIPNDYEIYKPPESNLSLTITANFVFCGHLLKCPLLTKCPRITSERLCFLCVCVCVSMRPVHLNFPTNGWYSRMTKFTKEWTSITYTVILWLWNVFISSVKYKMKKQTHTRKRQYIVTFGKSLFGNVLRSMFIGQTWFFVPHQREHLLLNVCPFHSDIVSWIISTWKCTRRKTHMGQSKIKYDHIACEFTGTRFATVLIYELVYFWDTSHESVTVLHQD